MARQRSVPQSKTKTGKVKEDCSTVSLNMDMRRENGTVRKSHSVKSRSVMPVKDPFLCPGVFVFENVHAESAMLCYVFLYYATLHSYSTLREPVLCYIMCSCFILCCGMRFCVMLHCRAILYCVSLCCATLCVPGLFSAMLCDSVLCYTAELFYTV